MLIHHDESDPLRAFGETLVAQAPWGVAYLNKAFECLQVNPLFRTLCDIQCADVLGKPLVHLSPQLWILWEPLFRRVLAGETIRDHVFRLPASHQDAVGCFLPVHVADQLIGLVVSLQDLSLQHKLAEAHYRKLFDYAPDGLVIADSESTYLDANPSMCRMLGYTREEFIGLNAVDIVEVDERSHIRPALQTIRADLDYYREWRFRRKDGSVFPAEVIATLMPGGQLLGMIRDISERKQAELRIQQLNRVYTVLSEVNQTIVREQNPQDLFDAACQIAVEKGLLRMAWIGLLEPESGRLCVTAYAGATPDTLALLSDLLGVNQHLCQCSFTYHALHAGEHGVCADVASDPLAESWREAGLERGYASMASLPLKRAGEVIGTFNLYAGQAHFFNADELRLLDEMAMDIGFALEVHEREAQLRLRDRAIHAVSQGIVITDPHQPDNPIIFASPGFENMTGYASAEIVGHNCRFLQGPGTSPDAVAQLRKAVQIQQDCTVELLNYRKDGSTFWNGLMLSRVLDPQGELTHFVGVLTDITERRLLEEQFHQSQKMEAMGQLAGGVAHDFNNLLTIINGYSEILLADTAPDDPKYGPLQEILKAGEWSASLTRQLLAFGRKQVLQPQRLNLNEVVEETQKMLSRMIGAHIQLNAVLSPHLYTVQADPGQLGQVLLNLAVNARDAMPQGGLLTLETRNLEGDASSPAWPVELAPGRYVALAVTDTGFGMNAETKSRLFEPFFTTKPADQGTGLGLAVVHGIVVQSGGVITVFSEPGVGSCFTLYLPAVDAAVNTIPEQPPVVNKGRETILLVEDDQAVRTLIVLILQEQGYRVLEAQRGEEALRLLKNALRPPDLLITDVVMPGFGGRELVKRLTAVYPGLKVLYISGYTDDAIMRHGILHKHVHFLLKPFLPTTLAHKVREVLASPSH